MYFLKCLRDLARLVRQAKRVAKNGTYNDKRRALVQVYDYVDMMVDTLEDGEL